MNIAELETTLDGFFAGCVDYKKRTMTLKDGKTAFLCDFKDLTDRRYIAERIVLPLLTADRVDDLERVVQTTAVTAVSDIAKLLEVSQSAVSHQLRVLKTSKLVKFRKEGKTVFYSLADEHVIRILSQGMEHIME